MSLSGILLGVLNIIIDVAILLLVGALIQWALSAIPANIVKLYLVIVALIAIYLLVALLLGMPSLRVIGFHGVADTAVAVLSSTAAADL